MSLFTSEEVVKGQAQHREGSSFTGSSRPFVVVVIRACDKGARAIVLDFDEYVRSTADVASGQLYYSPVVEFAVERTKLKI